MIMKAKIGWALAALIALAGARAEAGGSEDIKREIQSQQSATQDLEALDTAKAAAQEIALLRTWLDEAWNRHTKGQQGRAREVLDRCVAQAELIRKTIALAKLTAEADEKEKAAADSKQKVQRTKKALEQAIIKKKAMELNAK